MERMVACAVESLLDANDRGPLGSGLFVLMQNWLKRIVQAGRLDEVFTKTLEQQNDLHISDRVLNALGVTYDLDEEDRSRIPAKGPLIAVANHPFGGVEGLILSSILNSVRQDAKIAANYLLRHIGIQEVLDACIFVDPFARKDSCRANLKPLKEMIRWVRDGNGLGVFPAGEVSHLRLRGLDIADSKWSDTIARIVRKTEASVLPVYFEGRNSALFHLLGLVHPRLRTLMLPRESLGKANERLRVRVGKAIPFERLSRLDDREMMNYARLRTYMLGNRRTVGGKVRPAPAEETGRRIRREAAAPVAVQHLVREIESLPVGQTLVESGNFLVMSAMSWQAPNILQEIGRLREIAFRAAGEGTGNVVDKDRFDERYTHLFLWNKESKEVVGAYRLGLTDEIMSWYGADGLYTSTLFDYKRELLERISPAIELGRSFVRPEYQKSYQPLMLLWKGIGKFIAERPQYRFLFGPVSINNDYLSISRQLIVAYSKQKTVRSSLAGLVKGKNPPRMAFFKASKLNAACAFVEDIHELSELISDMEKDRKGIPILLKHYMKLGGEVLGFSVDEHFSDVLDALVTVDLLHTDPKILERYMGKEGAQVFLNHHRPGSRRRADGCGCEEALAARMVERCA